MKPFKELISEMFQESNGRGSGKRLVGFLTMIIVLVCTVVLVITEGCSPCVEDILQTLIISACALLGISSVASIFKGNKTSINENNNGDGTK